MRESIESLLLFTIGPSKNKLNLDFGQKINNLR